MWCRGHSFARENGVKLHSDIKLFYFMLKCKIQLELLNEPILFFLTTSRLFEFAKYKINDNKKVQ